MILQILKTKATETPEVQEYIHYIVSLKLQFEGRHFYIIKTYLQNLLIF